jgi:DNA-directed RNA polymerase subunit M/transcription elongation factor TFIIS
MRDRVTAILTERLCSSLSAEQITDLERGIYNASLKEAGERGVRRHWENPQFVQIYKIIARRCASNLDPNAYVHNKRLLQRLADGEFPPHQIPFMSHRDLYPENWQELADVQLKRETTMLAGDQGEGCDMFKCNRCGKSKTRYWEMQTRSADEPMTIFIRCLNCGKEWRK